jgi:hypothetical protein
MFNVQCSIERRKGLTQRRKDAKEGTGSAPPRRLSGRSFSDHPPLPSKLEIENFQFQFSIFPAHSPTYLPTHSPTAPPIVLPITPL